MKKKFCAGVAALMMAITSAMPVFAVEKVDEITGDLNAGAFFEDKTNAVELKDGEQYTFTFDQQSTGSSNWNCYSLVVANEGAVAPEYGGANCEIAVFRADSWGWGGGASDFVAPDAEGNKMQFTQDVDWTNWVADLQAGVECEVTIAKMGDTLIYNAKIGDNTVSGTETSGVALPESCYVFFTGENVDLTNFTTVKEKYKNPNALNVVDELSGDLTVDGYFTSKSDAVKVADGSEVTIKFTNKSDGTNNWDNFIVGIAGDAEGYNGEASEIVRIRADAWSLPGGMSDLESPDGAKNPMLFVNDINWDNFAAEMQAGAEVEVTIGKDGDLINYTAKIGSYTVESASLSGVALPDDIYVFLSGEKCTLSGIELVKETPPADSEPEESSIPDDSSTPDDSKPDESSTPDDSKPDDSSEPDSDATDGEDSSTPEDSSAPDDSSTPDDSSKPDDGDEPVDTWVKGDFSGDGRVNVSDIVLLAAHVKGIKPLGAEKLAKADLSGDGKVNVTDISLLAAHVKGIRPLK